MIDIWEEVKEAIEHVIDSITLEDMTQKYDRLRKQDAYEYVI